MYLSQLSQKWKAYQSLLYSLQPTSSVFNLLGSELTISQTMYCDSESVKHCYYSETEYADSVCLACTSNDVDLISTPLEVKIFDWLVSNTMKEYRRMSSSEVKDNSTGLSRRLRDQLIFS